LAEQSASTPRSALFRGYGFWKFPNFFRSVRIDAPSLGLSTATRLHFRRLTIGSSARQLPDGHKREGEPFPVYFMTGKEHWHMTAFCAVSLLRQTRTNIIPTILDDGTLGPFEFDQLRRILPQSEFLNRNECDARVNETVPATRYPSLHLLRTKLPLMRKLMDLHAGRKGWRLFLDSDMLFHSEPNWMLKWLRSAQHPIYMWDYQNSYGYSDALTTKVLGKPMRPMVNTGLYGLKSEAVDWDRLEYWAGQLYSAEGVNHFTEQCLIAMDMAENGSCPAPRDYLIWPDEKETLHPTAVMHHYVAESRTWYLIHGFPGLLRAARNGIGS